MHPASLQLWNQTGSDRQPDKDMKTLVVHVSFSLCAGSVSGPCRREPKGKSY